MDHTVFRTETCGTVLTVDVVSSFDAASLVEDCFSICRTFEKRYSRFIPGNRLDTVNKSGDKRIELDDEGYYLTKFSLELAQKTSGYFDPTIIRRLESYGYDKNYSFKKSELKGGEGYKHIELLDHAMILHNDVNIEYGSVGKGYLLDVMSEYLLKNGVDHFLLDFGGDIKGSGGYMIGLENPFDLTQIIGTINVDGFSVASSNGQKRKVGDFHHLLDPHTGKPVNSIAGVYIQSDSGLLADAYSTAVFVSGPEKGKELLAMTDEISGMIVFADGTYRKKEGYTAELFM